MVLDSFRRREPRLVALDVAETLALLVVPALVVGGGFALVGGREGFLTGLFAGGFIGAVLARGRWTLQAVRADDGDGIERRTRPLASPDSEENPLVRVSSLDYDERYDRLLVVVFLAVGVGSFGLVASGVVADWSIRSTLLIVILGIVSWTSALLTIGTLDSSQQKE